MCQIGAFEAKNRLSELLAAVENGEEVTITKHGRPVAKLVPFTTDDQGSCRESAYQQARRAATAGGAQRWQ